MSEYKDFLTHFKGKMNSQQPEAAKESTPEEEGVQKNIKSTPLLQTSGSSQLHIQPASVMRATTLTNTNVNLGVFRKFLYPNKVWLLSPG